MLQRLLFNLKNNFFFAIIVPKVLKNDVGSKTRTLRRSSIRSSNNNYDTTLTECGTSAITHYNCFYPPWTKRYWELDAIFQFTMDSTATVIQRLQPPARVRGMTKLDKSLFDDVVYVIGVKVQLSNILTVTKILKHNLLKMPKLKCVVELEASDPMCSTHRLILLDPKEIHSWEAIPRTLKDKLQSVNISNNDFQTCKLMITYDNWNFTDVISAILPQDLELVSGYTQVGHIAHFNLREQSLPFAHIIGEILLDKSPSIKTVVNKINTIDNTFRTFHMQLMAGEDRYITQTKENGFLYKLDFSQVYWNSRLGTEHERQTKHLTSTDVVFDVFAGIGPFAVPAGKCKSTVFANDLNPVSFEYLVKNTQLNSLGENISCFNLDGREFITTVIKEELTKIYKNSEDIVTKNLSGVTILMNLPALAVTFLDAFVGLLSDLKSIPEHVPLPKVHCYCFTNKEMATQKFDGDINLEVKQRVLDIVKGISEEEITLRFVRNVSPQKDMLCITFVLTPQILCGREEIRENYDEEPPRKCARLTEH